MMQKIDWDKLIKKVTLGKGKKTEGKEGDK